MTQLPLDFKEFLRLLNSWEVEYLIIGGYAVGYYGYVRATADLDIWIALDVGNANRAAQAIREFGFDVPELSADLLTQAGKIIRMGNPPFRLEVLTSISGVEFTECYLERTAAEIDGLPVSLISLRHLRLNKAASGRAKDLADIEHLSGP